MRKTAVFALAMAALVGTLSTGSADEPILRAPFIRFLQQPGTPPPLPQEPPPVVPEQLRFPVQPGQPPASAPVVVQAMYHPDFVRAFRPMAGTHQVTLVHPYTCCPVTVCFTLPCGCPKVKCRRSEIEFDYGKQEVEIRFYRNGDVRVKYRDGCCLLNLFR